MNAAEDGLTVDRNKNSVGKRRSKDIDSVPNKKGFGLRESARDPVFTTCERDKTIPYVAIL